MTRRSYTLLSTLTCFAGLLLGASATAHAQYYAIQDLGVMSGDTTSYAININDAGQVVGQSGSHAVLWNNGVLINPGNLYGSLSGINAQGDAVGSKGQYSLFHAFEYTAGGSIYDLHYTIDGTVEYSSYASGINNQGEIVGGAVGSDDYEFAFLYNQNGAFNLGTLGGHTSHAFAINNHSELVGVSDILVNGHGYSHAFFYRWPQYGLTDMGSLMGPTGNSIAYDINDSTQVVGWSDTYGGLTRAFLWSPTSAMRDLGTLGGANSYASGINNSTQVVGSSMLANGNSHAFLWTAVDGMRDLNTVIPSNSGWELLNAQAINNVSQIVGMGTHNGQQRAFLMTPLAIHSLVVTPNNLSGGNNASAIVTLNGPTPVDVTINLTNTNPAVHAPATLVIHAGASSGSVVLTTTPVTANTSGQIIAAWNGVTLSAGILVRLPQMKTLTLNPTSVIGGNRVAAAFTLDGPVATDTTVTFASSDPSVAFPTITSLVLPAKAKSGTFTVQTNRVKVNTGVAISATANRVAKSAALQVRVF